MPDDEGEIEKLKQELKESKRLIDLVADGDVLAESREREIADQEAQDDHDVVDARVRDEEEFCEEEEEEERQKEAGRLHQEGGQDDGTAVLGRDELLSQAKYSRGGYFVVERPSRKQ